MGEHIKLIILDRDGVINYDSDHYIKSEDEWRPIPGSLEAIARLNGAGYQVAVATNQSGIARGYYDLDELEKMHQKMQALLAALHGRIDEIQFCPHGPNDQCECRKPKPGMLLKIAEKFSLAPDNVLFIGDTETDLKAAKAAKMQFVLVKTGKGKRTLASMKQIKREKLNVYPSLQAFVDALLDIELG